MIFYICNFSQGNVDNRDGCAVFRLQNVLDEEKGWIRDQLCNSTTHRSHQKFHSQLLQFKFKYKGGSSDTHTIQQYKTVTIVKLLRILQSFGWNWNWPWGAGPLLGPKPASPRVWRPPETREGGYVKRSFVVWTPRVLDPIIWFFKISYPQIHAAKTKHDEKAIGVYVWSTI